uniref:hypothetical protein n=1 Tax=Escherichia coli TaxID=562 RepID=UPI0013AFFC00
YRAKDFEDAVEKAEKLVAMGGIGHTSCLYTDQDNQPARVSYFAGRTDETTSEFFPLSEDAISRALRNYGLHPEQLDAPAPHTEV